MTKIATEIVKFGFTLCAVAFAVVYARADNTTDRFLQAERNNSLRISDSEVDEQYMPWSAQVFDVPYTMIDGAHLHVFGDTHLLGAAKDNDGTTKYRFYVHPESAVFYKPLLDRYGLAGHVTCTPTSSTRTLLCSSPDDFFLKTSLAKLLNNRVRVIPAWEIKRSVSISQDLAKIPDAKWLERGVYVIKEPAGAYVDASLGLSIKVKPTRAPILEHGYIIRDSSFIKKFADYDVKPYFSLFVESGNEPPPIIKLWRKSKKNFYQFVADYLFRPVVEKNAFLMFDLGYAPEIHGQNLLFAFDKKTSAIEYVLHRDLGSFKINPWLRWIKGLPIPKYLSEKSIDEFHWARANETIEADYQGFFFEGNFLYNYGPTIEKYVPKFNATKLSGILDDIVKEQMRKSLPVETDSFFMMSVTEYLEAYIDEHIPELKGTYLTDHSRANEWIKTQIAAGEFTPLPKGWQKKWNSQVKDQALLTNYGVVTRHGSELILVPLTSTAPIDCPNILAQ